MKRKRDAVIKPILRASNHKMSGHRIPLSTSFNDAAGSTQAGHFLYRLAWHDKYSTIVRDGERWVIHTREWWMDELGFTVNQYNDALAKMIATGLATKSHHIFQNVRMTHLRLTNEGRSLAQLVEQRCAKEPIQDFLDKVWSEKSDTPMSGNSDTPMSEKPDTYKKEQGGTYKEEQQGVDTTLEIQKIDMTKTADVYDTVTAKESKPIDLNKSVTNKMYEIWRTVWVENYGDNVVSWSAKNKKLMAAFEAACPEEKGLEIFEKALRDWDALMDFGVANHGMYKPPATPQLWIFTSRPQVVVDFWEKTMQTTVENGAEDWDGFDVSTDDMSNNGE